MWLLVIREVEKTPLGSMEASVRIVIDIRGALLVHKYHMMWCYVTHQSEKVQLEVTLELKIKFREVERIPA